MFLEGYSLFWLKRCWRNHCCTIGPANPWGMYRAKGLSIVVAMTTMLPKVIESGIPFFAPFSGALSIRAKNTRNVFNIRASYADEVEQLVQHLTTVGIKRIAIVYQNNSFGKEVFSATQQAMVHYKL